MINIKELLSIEKHPKVQQTYILPSFENSKSLKIELQCDDDKYHSDKRLSELMEKYSEFRFRNENHIHIFMENYADKWAFPLSEFNIKTNDDFLNQSYDFCQFCNIINIKFAKGDLFC
ncbi:hypothetical protein E1I28_06195 [Campylobacter coli]|nr:hypothetical protein [Campylobacter coli]